MLFLQKRLTNKIFLEKLTFLNNLIINKNKKSLPELQSSIEFNQLFSVKRNDLEKIKNFSDSGENIVEIILNDLKTNKKKEFLKFYSVTSQGKINYKLFLGNQDFVELLTRYVIIEALNVINFCFFRNLIDNNLLVNRNFLIKEVTDRTNDFYVYQKYCNYKKTNVEYKKSFDFFKKTKNENKIYSLYRFVYQIFNSFESLNFLTEVGVTKKKYNRNLTIKKYEINLKLLDFNFLSDEIQIPMLVKPTN